MVVCPEHGEIIKDEVLRECAKAIWDRIRRLSSRDQLKTSLIFVVKCPKCDWSLDFLLSRYFERFEESRL